MFTSILVVTVCIFAIFSVIGTQKSALAFIETGNTKDAKDAIEGFFISCFWVFSLSVAMGILIMSPSIHKNAETALIQLIH